MNSMKKTFFCLLAFSLIICVNANAAGIREYYEEKDFSDNIGKQWLLTNVNIDGRDAGFSRDKLSGMFNEEVFFTLKFDTGILSGMGVPNRFSGPYTTGDKQALKIMPMRSTLMASLFEPESLREHDYFNYLQSAYKWQRRENKLEIYSKVDAQEVVMTFIDSE